jgi:uncharacterized protein (DUF58 family)
MSNHSESRGLRNLFFSNRWYLLLLSNALLFLCAYFFPLLYPASVIALALVALLTLIDYVLLFGRKSGINARRDCPAVMSLGDPNEVSIHIANNYPFRTGLTLIDELPYQFQRRDFLLQIKIEPGQNHIETYNLEPQSRGAYTFGILQLYAQSPLRLLRRRYRTTESFTTKVYPSFTRLKEFRLQALSESYTIGSRKLRKIGHSMEFEQIKEYVSGDDIRSINWKASARKGGLMMNTYTDTRQQQICCIIDKGRSMMMPFKGLSLLDYAINAALALSYVALEKQDNAGLISITENELEMISPDRRPNQFRLIRESLYQQQTRFLESNFETLQLHIARKINQRSLLVLFTNFETMAAMERQLPYLRQIAKRHLLCVVFFENTELSKLSNTKAETVKDIYLQTIASRFDFEKRQIVKELRRHGILSLLCAPKELSSKVIEQYLELKSRQLL